MEDAVRRAAQSAKNTEDENTNMEKPLRAPVSQRERIEDVDGAYKKESKGRAPSAA